MHYIVNAQNLTRRSLKLRGYRCIGPCLPAVTAVVISSNITYWSNLTTWKNGSLPKAGEDVVIEPGQNIVYDLEESPIFNYVQINGRLTFLLDAPKLHLRAKYIFVRAGELLIGNETHPFKGQAKITLYGEFDARSIVYSNAIEAGNKILANTGLMKMFGVPRQGRSRLYKTANRLDSSITVEPGLNWRVNDSLAISMSRLQWHEADYAVIKTYDNVTGEITLDRPLNYFHFGQATSTGPNYSGVDMRAEVMMLSRNIKIAGNDTESWGC